MSNEEQVQDNDVVEADEPTTAVDNKTASSESNAKAVDLAQMLTLSQEEAAKNLEGWQRALADLANARKRFEKQSQMAYDNATVALVNKLLPAIDDFERAMDNVPEEVAELSWFDGMSGVLRKLNSILESINAERITAVGEPFDPNLHDALSTEESDTYESGIIIRELVAGYRIGERIIRPALVVVAA